MVIKHNLQAMNSNRMLSISTKNLSTSTEKLSSGYKINRAADNAAGLSISEKMRKQIRGLTQASTNSEDGISMVQTAEGALQEVHDMLHRMNELCVQAANGTSSLTDRMYIQDELDQLISEIDRVSETTRFNETYLLNLVVSETRSISETTRFNETYLLKGDTQNGTENVYTVKYKKSSPQKQLYNADGEEISEIRLNDYFNEDGKYIGGLFTSSIAAVSQQVYSSTTASGYIRNVSSIISDFVTQTTQEINKNFYTDVHAGADSDRTNKIPIDITALSSAGLGIHIIKSSVTGVVDETGMLATDSIRVIANAIQKVSTQRSSLGAVQNRLEHTIKNLDNVVENTAFSESRIRDTDMAKEMVNYSNTSILTQAGQSMLAQSNQSKQGILSVIG